MAIFFDLSSDIITNNCQFKYCLNNTAVLGGGNEIILANWLNKKSIEFTSDSDILVRLLHFTYVLINRGIL